MILPKIRDKRFITIRRGGTLTDENHHLLAIWAAECSEHVLHLFENARPNDERPRRAIQAVHAWSSGTIKMMRARDTAGAAQDAAREVKAVSEAARLAALSAGQAAAVAHVAANELGAAAYAIRAVMAATSKDQKETIRCQEREWQRTKLPEQIRELVLDDQRLRNELCWFVFSDWEDRMSNLTKLPNIAAKLESQLSDVGITTADELKKVGSREAWLRILALDPSACLMRLSALEGAIQGVRWHHMDDETKAALKAFYNAHKGTSK